MDSPLVRRPEFLIVPLLFSPMVQALEEGTAETLGPIVITASRAPTPQEKVAQSVTIIEPTEADRASGRLVYDLLRAAPGVTVINSGGSGQQSSIFLRGAAYQQTLVLLDGVTLNDPSTPGRGYDFGQLNAQQIERIEILKGSQSGVHGPNAVGGVINIITRRENRDSMQVFGEYGTYNTRKLSAQLATGMGPTRVDFSALMENSEGFPSAGVRYGNQIHNGYDRLTGALSIRSTLSESWSLEAGTRAYRSETSLPYSGGAQGDDPNYTGKEAQGTARLKLDYQGSESWKPSFGVSYFVTARSANNLADAVHATPSNANYHGARLKAEQINVFPLTANHRLIVGVDTQIEKAAVYDDYEGWVTEIPSVKQSVTGIFAEDQWESGSFFIGTAVRADRFHGFNDVLTYRIGPGWTLADSGTTLKASLGRGFKVPSLDQLYAPTYGNTALKSETSLSSEVTLEQGFGKKNLFRMTGFQTMFENLIAGDPNDSYRYKNVARASSTGLETCVESQALPQLLARMHHTWLFTRNEDTGAQLARRPRHSMGVDLDYSVTDDLQVGGRLQVTGARYDDTSNLIRMPGYALLSIQGSYRWNYGLRAFGRIENALDREYEEIQGYGTAGRTLSFGLKKEI